MQGAHPVSVLEFVQPPITRRAADADTSAAARTRDEVHASSDRFGVVNDRAGLDALEPEWNDLFRRAGRDIHVFQTFNWNWHWANHYLRPAREAPALAIVTVHRHGRLVLLWPLVMERSGGLTVLRWMGEPVSQYGDVLVDDVPDRQALLQRSFAFIASELRPDVIHLRKVRADANAGPLLRAMRMRPVAVADAPYLHLASAPDFAHYERRYSAKARKNRRRLMRRLEERGPIAIERHAGTTEAGVIAHAAIVSKGAWTRSTGRIAAAISDRRFAAFFADVVEARTHPAGCGIVALKSNGAIAGVAIDVSCGGRRCAHVIVHDPRLNQFSAGTLLLQEWIRDASADGIATFDLLAPAYAYKSDWADGTMAVHDYAAGFTLAGRLFARLYLGLVRESLKSAVEVLPKLVEPLRRSIAARPQQDRSLS
jgi:CelD/BcsL family acetyltransferase involved in cellulose biosynthesis